MTMAQRITYEIFYRKMKSLVRLITAQLTNPQMNTTEDHQLSLSPILSCIRQPLISHGSPPEHGWSLDDLNLSATGMNWMCLYCKIINAN
jgi:hypothetical protein